ncbi:MAG: hypothetical protein NC924_07770 [Candidatus Omnitrophica bacterium]|nr:hypothetical protein [Candidatus Omnitrophota bacterium]
MRSLSKYIAFMLIISLLTPGHAAEFSMPAYSGASPDALAARLSLHHEQVRTIFSRSDISALRHWILRENQTLPRKDRENPRWLILGTLALTVIPFLSLYQMLVSTPIHPAPPAQSYRAEKYLPDAAQQTPARSTSKLPRQSDADQQTIPLWRKFFTEDATIYSFDEDQPAKDIYQRLKILLDAKKEIQTIDNVENLINEFFPELMIRKNARSTDQISVLICKAEKATPEMRQAMELELNPKSALRQWPDLLPNDPHLLIRLLQSNPAVIKQLFNPEAALLPDLEQTFRQLSERLSLENLTWTIREVFNALLNNAQTADAAQHLIKNLASDKKIVETFINGIRGFFTEDNSPAKTAVLISHRLKPDGTLNFNHTAHPNASMLAMLMESNPEVTITSLKNEISELENSLATASETEKIDFIDKMFYLTQLWYLTSLAEHFGIEIDTPPAAVHKQAAAKYMKAMLEDYKNLPPEQRIIGNWATLFYTYCAHGIFPDQAHYRELVLELRPNAIDLNKDYLLQIQIGYFDYQENPHGLSSPETLATNMFENVKEEYLRNPILPPPDEAQTEDVPRDYTNDVAQLTAARFYTAYSWLQNTPDSQDWRRLLERAATESPSPPVPYTSFKIPKYTTAAASKTRLEKNATAAPRTMALPQAVSQSI